jgi:dihydroneopterin aldolase
VAERILAEPQAMRTFVRVEKLDRGPGALGVEIARSRAEVPPAAQGAALPAPLVVHLDNAAIASAGLAAMLDGFQAGGAPVVLTVGLPDTARPQTGHGPTQRRIDLLAIEQNAWVLAARDPRCVVVATRTEIDWALRHGRMIVWAPSKLVLDAVDGPKGRDPVGLALWLAEHLGAARLVVHGSVAVPAGSRVPVLRA